MFDEKSRESKEKCAIEDFDLLLQPGNIAFYKGCEVTQIFLFESACKKVKNYFTLFVFDEIDKIDERPRYLSRKLEPIDKKYSLGIQQKRISLDLAKKNFLEIKNGKMNYDKECEISQQMALFPKTYVPSHYSAFPPLLNLILKPNYWGDSYIIEFFDRTQMFLDSDEESRNTTKKINEIISSVPEIHIDLSKVYDRVGNIIFQFPITVLTTKIFSEKDSVNLGVESQYHPSILNPKNLHIQMSASLDDVITGFNATDTTEAKPKCVLKVGDDNSLSTTIFDKSNALILHNSTAFFIKELHVSGRIGMQYSAPRTVKLKNGKEEHEEYIELFQRNEFKQSYSNYNDYFEIIRKRHRNNELLSESGDYRLFKCNEHSEALEYLREKIKDTSGAIKEICLWDPYLTALDIMETLYFENTGLPFRCITNYHNAKKCRKEVSSFEQFCEDQKKCFEQKSNNLRVKLKFLAQHDGYGWKFHDRFLIFVPYDSTDLPIVYSLGTSINSVGKDHHIIQKVTNPREILDNFDELWNLLDNGKCLVAEFK